MTNFGSAHPHLASLTNSRFLAAFGEGMTLASVVSPLHALLRRVLPPTLDSVNKRMLARIYSEKHVMWPSRSALRKLRNLTRGPFNIHV